MSVVAEGADGFRVFWTGIARLTDHLFRVHINYGDAAVLRVRNISADEREVWGLGLRSVARGTHLDRAQYDLERFLAP
jgi:hypothetical protein